MQKRFCFTSTASFPHQKIWNLRDIDIDIHIPHSFILRELVKSTRTDKNTLTRTRSHTHTLTTGYTAYATGYEMRSPYFYRCWRGLWNFMLCNEMNRYQSCTRWSSTSTTGYYWTAQKAAPRRSTKSCLDPGSGNQHSACSLKTCTKPYRSCPTRILPWWTLLGGTL